MTKKRLSKALAAAGVGSRRHVEELIERGKVSVNKTVATSPGQMIDWATDRITVHGQNIKGEEKKVYYLLNKPIGYLCSNKRLYNQKLVIDLFDKTHRLFTVGRLDKETSGLILVTNDGDFANQVMHPSFNISKEYLIKTEQEIMFEHLQKLTAGTTIEDSHIKPHKVKKMRRGTAKITVKDGKKHEVRLLVKNAGLNLLSLTRIRIGPLQLGNLPVGASRPLSEKERKELLPNP